MTFSQEFEQRSSKENTALLICPYLHRKGALSLAHHHQQELSALVQTMGYEVREHLFCPLRSIVSATFIGKGKIEEIHQLAQEIEVEIVVFDDDLSPPQQRNLEAVLGIPVIDRQEVILEIFAARAQTREAVLQVALARMEYSLPRLTRFWTHLSRQKGGTKGTRGEGETQLEIDRRIVQRKIDSLKKELEKVQSHREISRHKRMDTPVPSAAIVGYTNAGKSSLLNTLTEAGVLSENKLFATLDSTTRKISMDGGMEFLLTDTVGFIEKLPHHLVEAFKSTLEEARYADILLHVVDVSHPRMREHIKVTREVLRDLGAQDKPEIMVFNKIDNWEDSSINRSILEKDFPGCLFISLYASLGLETLEKKILHTLQDKRSIVKLFLPFTQGALVSFLHKRGQVLQEKYEDTGIYLEVVLDQSAQGKVSSYVLS